MHKLGQNKTTLLWPLLDEAWNFYHAFPVFFLYYFGSYSFTHLMNLWSYKITDFGVTSLNFFLHNESHVSDQLRVCLYLLALRVYRPFLMLPQCMFLKILGIKLLFFCNPNHFYNYFPLKLPTTMRYHRCFRELIFSGRKVILGCLHKVLFITPNYSRISL